MTEQGWMRPFWAIRLVVASATVSLLAGCSTFSSWKHPGAHLDRIQHLYVEATVADGRQFHATLAQELRAMGYTASSGPLTMLPREADAILTYNDRWAWDFTTYLIELDVQIRDVRTETVLARSRYHRPALAGTSTDEVVRRALRAILPQRNPSPSAQPK